jgi:putative colanic acid biosynthesis acetyltransferase WcaF
MLLWEVAWAMLCRWTPKPFNRWRLVVLKAFGGEVQGRPFVHQRARIQIPWHIVLEDRACIGDLANLYSLGRIVVREGAVLAQESYVCTGTHDFTRKELPLVTKPVEIGRDAFVGARAFLMPGVTVGRNAIVGACAVVTCNVDPGAIVAGNPAREIGRAPRKKDETEGFGE